MNSYEPTGTVGIERIRYEAGTNYAVNKLISLEMKLRAETVDYKKTTLLLGRNRGKIQSIIHTIDSCF